MAEGARRILLAEDDRFLRKAAVDGEEAVRVARAERPDLVLLATASIPVIGLSRPLV